MEFDFIIIGRSVLIVFSIIAIAFSIWTRTRNRLGNEFFVIITIFWIGVLIIAINPAILDSVLNSTGFVNRAQFLLSVSIVIILYLLSYQLRKNKTISENLSKTVREIALDYFKREIADKKSNYDVAIVIVGKNEEKTIGKVIDDIKSQSFSFTYGLIVVNDGSNDNTESIAREKGTSVITHYQNLGVGGANKTGYLAAILLKPRIVVNIDADGQHDPSYIEQLVEKIDEGYDMVYGSRFAKQSEYDTNTVRLVGNKFYTNLVNRLGKIKISDVTSGYRAIKMEKLQSIYYNSETNFAIELALRGAKNGLKITEIPTRALGRIHGKSQFYRLEKFIVYNINALIQILNAYFRKPKIPELKWHS